MPKGHPPTNAFKKGHKLSPASQEKLRQKIIAAHKAGKYISRKAKENRRRGLIVAQKKKKFGFPKGSVPWNKGKTNAYSIASRQKMSLSHKGKKPSTKELEHRSQGLRAAHKAGKKFGFPKGSTPWNKGIPMLQETRDKVSTSRKGIKAGNHNAHLNGVVTRYTKGDPRLVTHGLAKHFLYMTHSLMMERCYDPKKWAYPQYGGANPPVTVWEPWHDAQTFVSGIEVIIGPKPYRPPDRRIVKIKKGATLKLHSKSYGDTIFIGPIEIEYEQLRPGMTLDRINPWEGYYPWNVRWADPSTQTINRREKITPYFSQSGEH